MRQFRAIYSAAIAVIVTCYYSVASAGVPDIQYVPHMTVLEGQKIVLEDHFTYGLGATHVNHAKVSGQVITGVREGRSYLYHDVPGETVKPLYSELLVLPKSEKLILESAMSYLKATSYLEASRYYEGLARCHPDVGSYSIQTGVYRLLALLNSTHYRMFAEMWATQMGKSFPLSPSVKQFIPSLTQKDVSLLKNIVDAPFGILKDSQHALPEWIPYLNYVLVPELEQIGKFLDQPFEDNISLVIDNKRVNFDETMYKNLMGKVYFFSGLVRQHMAYDWSEVKNTPQVRNTMDAFSMVRLKRDGAFNLMQAYHAFVKASEYAPDSAADSVSLKEIIMGHVEPVNMPYYQVVSNRKVLIEGKSLSVTVDFKSFYTFPPSDLGTMIQAQTYAGLLPNITQEIHSVDDQVALVSLFDYLIVSLPRVTLR